MYDLTGFQRDLLYVIAGIGRSSGQEIKSELEDDFGVTVNHGRLYPNLDVLAEASLVEKGTRNRRANDYRITRRGEYRLVKRRRWEDDYVADLLRATA
jgi:DNA-binding PadR family transcriptional regulator